MAAVAKRANSATMELIWRAAIVQRLSDEAAREMPKPVLPKQEPKQAEPAAAAPKAPEVDKSFKLNIGGMLTLPTRSAKEKPQLTHVPQQKPGEALKDPFEGLPFRGFAEKMGAAVMPAIQAMREEQRAAAAAARGTAEVDSAPPEVPVPHFLPFTRWAAHSDRIRSTFIAEDPKTRKKARLSWYHPDDGMVPRGWFSQGLMADIKYYMPFSKSETQPAQ